MLAIPTTTDILGFNLNADQKGKLSELHRLCEQRMAVPLPVNVNSVRCKAYDVVQALDERIAKYAPLLELKRVDTRRERNEATGNVDEVRHETPVSAEGHTRIVWQYWFIKHPISM